VPAAGVIVGGVAEQKVKGTCWWAMNYSDTVTELVIVERRKWQWV
jgi:hypothetical protein